MNQFEMQHFPRLAHEQANTVRLVDVNVEVENPSVQGLDAAILVAIRHRMLSEGDDRYLPVTDLLAHCLG